MRTLGAGKTSVTPALGKNPRILVSRTDRIGDLVLSLPVVKSLKSTYPHARVDLLVRQETAPVVEGQPGVGGVVIYDSQSDSQELTARLSAGRYDAAICLYPRPELASIFARARIPMRIGTGRRWYAYRFTHRVNISRRRSGRHEKDLNLDLLKPLGIEPDYSLVPELALNSGSELRSGLPAFLRSDRVKEGPLIVIHPGDGGSAVNWSIEHYAELAGLLVGEGIDVVITGLSTERKMHLDRFTEVVGEDHILSGRTGLPQLMQVLNRAGLFVGGSTGPLHLAAALGTPVVGIYGPIYTTTPDRWGPCGAGHIVFVPEVPICRCKVGSCRLGDCMERIKIDDVRGACRRIVWKADATNSPDTPNNTRPVSDLSAREGLCP